MHTQHLTKADFLDRVANFEVNPKEWVFLGKRPCIVDFYADWCNPCRMIAPVLEELAKEYGDKMDIYKVDTEKEHELSAVFGIRSVPTLLFCPVGEKPQLVQGAMGKEGFVNIIDELLLNKVK